MPPGPEEEGIGVHGSPSSGLKGTESKGRAGGGNYSGQEAGCLVSGQRRGDPGGPSGPKRCQYSEHMGNLRIGRAGPRAGAREEVGGAEFR